MLEENVDLLESETKKMEQSILEFRALVRRNEEIEVGISERNNELMRHLANLKKLALPQH